MNDKPNVLLTYDEAGYLLEYLDLRGFASEDMVYGHFAGGDPRDFSCDVECSTEEERAQHKADCERWAAAEKQGKAVEAEPGPHSPIINSEGREVGYVTRSGYGLGSNRIPPDPQAIEIFKKLRSAWGV